MREKMKAALLSAAAGEMAAGPGLTGMTGMTGMKGKTEKTGMVGIAGRAEPRRLSAPAGRSPAEGGPDRRTSLQEKQRETIWEFFEESGGGKKGQCK